MQLRIFRPCSQQPLSPRSFAMCRTISTRVRGVRNGIFAEPFSRDRVKIDSLTCLMPQSRQRTRRWLQWIRFGNTSCCAEDYFARWSDRLCFDFPSSQIYGIIETILVLSEDQTIKHCQRFIALHLGFIAECQKKIQLRPRTIVTLAGKFQSWHVGWLAGCGWLAIGHFENLKSVQARPKAISDILL